MLNNCWFQCFFSSNVEFQPGALFGRWATVFTTMCFNPVLWRSCKQKELFITKPKSSWHRKAAGLLTRWIQQNKMSNPNPDVVVIVVTGLAGRCLLRTSQHGAKTLAENSSVFRGESPHYSSGVLGSYWQQTWTESSCVVSAQQAVFISSVGE